ncbi:AT-rich interactive domain-containing protein 1B-like isoform X2 [Oncorhynchus tshawytscha]|uniref:AT-rich interactive domain-containing protein 1B-like isoform X2 n=1 Tax=Oncorhynchus tshawytscha TaxID=74940 RepID=UPI001C3CB35D|nr:AT-rich interactive domain-containing protein 1B-like isoform X2 [Oncorhynchus tshawytscha]
MAAQVATAPTSNGKKRSNLASSLSQDLKSGKSGVVGGAVLGVGNGTNVHAMNNVERHELNPTSRARASPANNDSNPREKESRDSRSASFSTSNSSMETGMFVSHKVKNVGGEDTPSLHHTPPQQQPFNQFLQHQQRQIQNNNQQSLHGESGNRQHGESGNRQHGGKGNVVLGNTVERHQQQEMLNKNEDDQPSKTEDRLDSRYEHASSGPTNNINTSQGGTSSVSEFNSYYGNGKGGPCFDQHGGQQSPGSGIMHSVQQNMDQVQQNSHEGYHNNPYNHYPAYRPGYGNSGYGMMSPSRQGNNMMGLGSNTAAANHSKAAMAAASSGGANVGGFQRFPGQTQQHPSGATPTLNQLLTSPSPMMRGYGGGYQDYTNPSAQQQQSSMGLTKDINPQYGSVTHVWGGQQRNHPAMSPGNNGQGSGRSQVPPMDAMAMKRSQLYGIGNNPYSQQQQGGGGSYPGQPYGSPSPHRYPMGMHGRGQVGMSGMQYPQQQQMVAQYGQQHQGQQGGYCQPQGQSPYFSPPQQQPTAPTQPPYMQPRPPPPQQDVSQEGYGNRGQSAMTPGKPNHEEMGLSQQDRPSSLPDLSGTIDDLPTGTEVAVSSAVSASGSTSSQGEQSNPAQSPFSPHVSPRLPGLRSGPSPSPVGSPVGSSQSRSGPISPASVPGTQMAPQTPGNMSDVGSHSTLSQSPMSQERGFPPAMQRNTPGPQQSGQGPPVSPHPSLGGSMHPGSYHQQQQGGPGPSYGSQTSQYGPQGNYPRPPNYGGAPSANYSGPGPGMSNSLGMNASSPMHGQGPGQPCGSMPAGRGLGPGASGRPYPCATTNTMAPTSPSMPQPAGQGQGMRPPLPNVNRKPGHEAGPGPNAMQGPNAGSNPSAQGRPPYARSPAYPSQSWPGVRPPLSPSPHPHPQTSPHPHPHPQYSPHPHYHPQHSPQPHPQHSHHPHPQPHPHYQPQTSPHPYPHPQDSPHPQPHPHPRPHPQPHHSPSTHPHHQPHPHPQTSPHPHPRPHHPPHSPSYHPQVSSAKSHIHPMMQQQQAEQYGQGMTPMPHHPGMNPMGPGGVGPSPGGLYSQQPGANTSGRMTPQGPHPLYNAPPPSGPMQMGGEGMVGPPDPKRRPPEQHREGNTPAPAIEPPPKPKDRYSSSQCMSQPPTPCPLSPSPASLSSCHGAQDSRDIISSHPAVAGAWPKTPTSPKPSPATMTNEKIRILYEMGGEPERRMWVDRYLAFMEERGTPVPMLPAVGKKPLDLCRLYLSVREIGGLAMVNKSKKWRELSTHLNVGTSSSSASSLKKQYIHYLFAFECKVERGEEPPLEIPGETKKQAQAHQARIQPPSPANSGSLQGPHTPQSTGSSSMSEMPEGMKRPTPATTPHGHMTPQPGNRNSGGIRVQDPFSEISDPAFHKRGPMPSGAPYQQSGGSSDPSMRMQYDANKDLYGGPQKGPGGSESYGPGQMPSGAVQDMYPRGPPSRAMPGMGMGPGPRPQYPYGPGYDRRPDHVMGPEGGMAPPGGQNNMGPSSGDPSMYSANRYPQQRPHGHESYGQQQYPHGPMPYGSHQPGMYPQQQGYKRPVGPEVMYGPPAKRHEGEAYSMQQYGGQQPGMYTQYGGNYMGPERRPMQGQYPYPYSRDRMGATQGPQQHAMMSGGPPASSGASAEGPQLNMWHPRTDMGYPGPYRGQLGQGPPYPGLGRGLGDDPEGRNSPDGQWPPGPPGQHQPPYPPHSSSASSMPPMASRQPTSYQSNPAMANHISRAPSPSPFPRPMGGSGPLSPNNGGPYMASLKKAGMPGSMPGSLGGGMSGQGILPLHRDISFPVGSVEATLPKLKARRRLTSKETGTPEAWRVMMSLKSGLLAESTWALDTINILLYDDNTVSSFTLAQLPGFLELIVEYFRRCLISIFGILDEYEVGTEGQRTLLGPIADQEEEPTVPELGSQLREEQRDNRPEEAEIEKPTANGSTEEAVPDEKTEEPVEVTVKEEKVEGEESEVGATTDQSEPPQPEGPPEPRPKQASKYDKLPIKVEEKSAEEDQVEERQGLSLPRGFSSGLLHWKAGGGDSTAHIQTHFEKRSEETDSKHTEERKVEEGAVVEKTMTETATVDEMLSARPGSQSLSERNDLTGTFSFVEGAQTQSPILTLLEDEPRCWDEAPLSTAEPWQDALARRCVCVSNIVRGLSFIPGNDNDMSRHPGLVLILGRLVLLHHLHPQRRRTPPSYQREEEQGRACSKDEWWWDCLSALRENTLVTLANISGQLDLSLYPESICLPILDGLLHWMVCPSAEAQDPFTTAGCSSSLTPQRLVLECLCKLSIQDNNVDLLLATPPFSRQEKLYATLVRHVGERKSQVCREMAVAVLSNLAQGDPTAARAIALQKGSVGTLIGFLEDCVAMAQHQQGPHSLLHPAPVPHPEPPSVNMMCRAAKALLAMAKVKENRPEFVLYESRLLDSSLSSVLSSAVAAIMCEVLFKIGRSS